MTDATRNAPGLPGRAGAVLVGLLTATLMLLSEPRLAIVWDEGYTLGRQERLRLWFGALRDPVRFAENWRPPPVELVQQAGAPPPRPDQVDSRAKLLTDPNVLAWFWPFAREEPHGHPPFYALVGLVGDLLAPGLPLLPRARLGPILLFSVTAGLIFGFTLPRWGRLPATVASASWVLQPNLFAHGHYATYDAILSALWVLGVMAYVRAVEAGPRSNPKRPAILRIAAFGLVLGCAFDTKLTGWFLPLPFLAWSLLARSRRGIITLAWGVAVGLAVLYALNPPWWTEPVAGVSRFFASNLDRARSIPIRTLFLGQVISTPDGSLPWYNTLLWTVLVTPVGFLILGLWGVANGLRRPWAGSTGLLLVLHWSFLMALRALPHTPGHDGVRQFLPAFGLLALLIAPGTAAAIDRLGKLGKALGAASCVEAAISVAVMMPVPMSYFSPVVGGLPGAARLGMEPTYYWDALDGPTRAWLRANTGPSQKVRFATFPTSWLYLRDIGELPPGLLPSDRGDWAWYVLQNRPGDFSPIDRALLRTGRPAHVVSKLGVPLLWVFPFEQVESRLAGPSGAAR